MTESEAIEELKYDCNELGKAVPCDTSWGSSFENAYGMAIQAVEKQMPKKVLHSYDDWCSCPICCFGLGWYTGKHYKYCMDCGQKLDWSDGK